MSMTTEQPQAGVPFWSRMLRGAGLLLALVAGWFGTMAGVMLFTDIAPAAVAIVPDVKSLGTISPDIKFVRSGRHVLVVSSARPGPGYVKQLYRAGAWLVLPALRSGCLDLTAVSRVVGLPPPVASK